MSSNNHLSQAKEVYRSVWDGGPYTSFDMIDYMIKKLQVDNPARQGNKQDFLRHQNILESVRRERMEHDQIDAGLKGLWNGRTGFCTSFAIKVVRTLESRHPGTFSFDYYDFGNHRIARCKKTKIVIDSSASHAFVLEDGKPMTIKKRTWYYDKSESKFKNSQGVVCWRRHRQLHRAVKALTLHSPLTH